MADLIGGIQYVTLSDDEAKRRKTQKTVLERKAYPAFEILIEINQQNSWTIHEDVKTSIDSLLRGDSFMEQIRFFSLPEKIKIFSERTQPQYGSLSNNQTFFPNLTWSSVNTLKHENSLKLKTKLLIIYPYSISNNLLKEVLLRMGINFILTNEVKKASIILGLKKHLNKNISLTQIATKYNIPIYSFNSISYYQLVRLFSKISY